jgi:hypothetical protein
MKIRLGKYLHYKGKEYEVKGTAIHSETREEMVIYLPLYDKRHLFVRPLKMFKGKVVVDGIKKPRFKFIGRA